MRMVISRIPACSIVALMFMLIGIIVLSNHFLHFVIKLERIYLLIMVLCELFFFQNIFLKNRNFILYLKGQFIRNSACVFWFINCLVV